MQGNIHIEVLYESVVMVAVHLKDVSDFDKQVLVMSLARSLDLTSTEILVSSLKYPNFLAEYKHVKTDLSNNRSTPD